MKALKRNLLTTLLLALTLMATGLHGQTVTTVPQFPTADATVTIFLDVTGSPLEGYNGEVYTHTGVTVNGSQWQYVIGSWGNNSNQPQLTKTGTNTYELEMTPTIRDFYGVPASVTITEMCFVFRAAEAAPQTVDVFVDVYSDELSLVIQEPSYDELLVQESDSIQVIATSPLADSMFIFIEGEEYLAVAGIIIEEYIPASELGELGVEHWVTIKAKNETGEVESSFSAIPIPVSPMAELPAGIIDGINYVDGSTVVLSLYAPLKKFVFLIGDFNSWEVTLDSYMNKTPDGLRYWIELTGLTPGEEYAYQYFVDGARVTSDPYSELVLEEGSDTQIPEETFPNLKPYPEETIGPVSVFQTNQEAYNWQNTTFEPPAKTDLVVYELLLRDFLSTSNYQTLIDTLSYLKALGINAIELMPVNEFDGNNSWGYNPNHFLALDKYYGTKNKFKEFVDLCHDHGIAVILDVVYNHATIRSPYVNLYFDENMGRPSEESPFYNTEPTHDFNVFYDMNHESEASQAYISRAVKYWLEEYRVDGYRFDLSKGFTQKNTLGNPGAMAQYDQDRIDIITHYADAAWSVNPDAYVILEHFADNSEEKVLSAYGCMLWGNSNHNYNEGTMGYNQSGKSDFSWISYQKRGWADPHVMGYMESHDEERLMVKNIAYGNSSGDYNTKDINIALKRMQLAAAFFFTIPGPKMIWEFGELGYDFNINYPGEIGGGEHRTDPKPIRWDYASEWNRNVLNKVYSELIHLKINEPVFETTDFELSVNAAMKKIHLNHESMNVTVLGNFDVEGGTISPQFQHTGMWYDYFAGDSLNVSDVSANINLLPGEYRIYTDKKFDRPEIGLAVNETEAGIFGSVALYPNPSNGQVSLSFELKEKSMVSVRIYNPEGQKVKEFEPATFSTGKHTLSWNGLAADGSDILPGIYFVEFIGNSSRSVQKLVVY